MVDLRNYNLMDWQEKVVEKYGWKTLQDVIDDAMVAFYTSVHKDLFSNKADNAQMDETEFVFKALDYIYQNDPQLQEDEEE